MKLAYVVFAVLIGPIPTSAFAQLIAFSGEPIRDPVFDSARVLVESVQLNNWLRENLAKAPKEQHKPIREHLHALIDSKVKEIYLREKSILPKQPDVSLAVLFSWASRVGVYGAEAAYRLVQGKYPVSPPAGPTPPAGISLALDGELFKISSELGRWTAVIPYYFFIFEVNDFTGDDARRTQYVLISMGTARDPGPTGFSQATLGLVYVPKPNTSGFVETWSNRIGVAGIPKRKIDSSVFESQVAYDPNTRLHKEVIFLSGSRGSFAVIYSGLDGTYQWNRRHFIDFVNALKIE